MILANIIKNHWKTIVVVLAISAAYSLGRFGHKTPTKIEYKEKEVIHTVTVEKVVTKVVEVKVKDSNVHKTRDRTITKKPDGTVVVVEHDDNQSSIHQTDNKNIEKVDETHKDVQLTKEVQKTEQYDNKPSWHLSPMIGFNLGQASLSHGFSTGPLIFGAHLERRIIGPIWLGAFGFTSGQVGLSIGLEH